MYKYYSRLSVRKTSGAGRKLLVAMEREREREREREKEREREFT